MKLEQSFDVAAPIETVWNALIDVERVTPCLPGAAVTGRNEDGSYTGTFTIKIGPTTASYAGRLAMENVDETARTATMRAQGTDKRGQGSAKATILSSLSPAEGNGTHVDVITDYHITGRLARFGRGGMIEDISERLLREFAQRLQDSFAQPNAGTTEPEQARPQPSEPVEGVSLVSSVLWNRVQSNPAPVALIAGLLLALLVLWRARR
jgi:carbon monoxide dehydrogenase subunit G